MNQYKTSRRLLLTSEAKKMWIIKDPGFGLPPVVPSYFLSYSDVSKRAPHSSDSTGVIQRWGRDKKFTQFSHAEFFNLTVIFSLFSSRSHYKLIFIKGHENDAIRTHTF
jgi:hypothetical protein